MTSPDAAPLAEHVLLCDPGDPFGDGEHWIPTGEVADEQGQPQRVLYECRYEIESGSGRAQVIERRWSDGQPESRHVTPIE